MHGTFDSEPENFLVATRKVNIGKTGFEPGSPTLPVPQAESKFESQSSSCHGDGTTMVAGNIPVILPVRMTRTMPVIRVLGVTVASVILKVEYL